MFEKNRDNNTKWQYTGRWFFAPMAWLNDNSQWPNPGIGAKGSYPTYPIRGRDLLHYSWDSQPSRRQPNMSEKDSLNKSQTDWARLEAMRDDEIDFSDIPALTEEQLQAMRPTA
jgi:hypothetical protein